MAIIQNFVVFSDNLSSNLLTKNKLQKRVQALQFCNVSSFYALDRVFAVFRSVGIVLSSSAAKKWWPHDELSPENCKPCTKEL